MRTTRLSGTRSYATISPADLFDPVRGKQLLFPSGTPTPGLMRLRRSISEGHLACIDAALQPTDDTMASASTAEEAGVSDPGDPQILTGKLPVEDEGTGSRWAGVRLSLISGVTRFYRPFSGAFGFVEAEWVVPNVELPTFRTASQWLRLFKQSSTNSLLTNTTLMKQNAWVGIDTPASSILVPAFLSLAGGVQGNLKGAGTLRYIPATSPATLWQGGTVAIMNHLKNRPHFVAWWQVLGPLGTGVGYTLQGFPVNAGDTVGVRIFRAKPGDGYAGAAHCMYTNWTQLVHTEFVFSCEAYMPGGQVLWIVERPGNPPKQTGGSTTSGGYVWLPRFGSLYFDNSHAGYYPNADYPSQSNTEFTSVWPGKIPDALKRTVDGADYSPVHKPDQTDSSGTRIVSTSILANDLIRCEYVYGPG
jgi:Peptidase A4 family